MGFHQRNWEQDYADGRFDLPALHAMAKGWAGLEGMDLARQVSCTQTYTWTEGTWSLSLIHISEPTRPY